MNLAKIFNSVHSLDNYINVTEEFQNKLELKSVGIDINTVTFLKELHSLEIEYFIKYEKHGAAFIIFECILQNPPSNNWRYVCEELGSVLRHWLEAVSKYFKPQSLQWWDFLKYILLFIQKLCAKDHQINNILLEDISECLLELSTSDLLELNQRNLVIKCLNKCATNSNREIRMLLYQRLNKYFCKLSRMMSDCGDLDTQLTITEMLLRWLINRYDPIAKERAAAKWFPEDLYSKAAIDVFLERSFQDFYKDARDFLAAHNEVNGSVLSVVCKRLILGNIVLIQESKNKNWLDINVGARSLTVMLSPRMLALLGRREPDAYGLLVVTEADAERAAMQCDEDVIISISMTTTPQFLDAGSENVLDGHSKNVTLTISSRSDIRKVDESLYKIFNDKYQRTTNFNVKRSPTPEWNTVDDTKKRFQFDEDTENINYNKRNKRRESGYITRQTLTARSPSSTSTTSLVQLRHKLATIPLVKYREVQGICAQPELSDVPEHSENDDVYNLYTVASFKDTKLQEKAKSIDDFVVIKRRYGTARRLSPVVVEETSTYSCLDVAGQSIESSVINDTLDGNINNPVDNLVEQLMCEALNAKPSGDVNVDAETSNNKECAQELTEAAENIPQEEPIGESKKVSNNNKHISSRKRCTVISNSTSAEESNTEVINETPNYVNVRRRKVSDKRCGRIAIDRENYLNAKITDENTNDDVENDFFLQHFKENPIRTTISPTLARRINQSSPECSDNEEEFDLNVPKENCDIIENECFVDALIEEYLVDEKDVVECLNSVLDQVHINLEQYLEENNSKMYNLKQRAKSTTDTRSVRSKIPQGQVEIINEDDGGDIDKTDKANVTLRFKIQAKGKTKLRKLSIKKNVKLSNNKTKNDKESTNDITVPIEVHQVTPKVNYNSKDINIDDVPLLEIKRRKLFSPNQEQIDKRIEDKIENETAEKEKSVIDTEKRLRSKSRNIAAGCKKIQKDSVPTTSKDKDLDDISLFERKKRKLYSPKEQEIDYTIGEAEDKGAHTDKREKRSNTSAVCYKEIEKDRLKYSMSRRRRSTVGKPPLSPKTIRNDDIFDKLKEDVNMTAGQIMLADKLNSHWLRSRDIAVYNFTSDSEDDNFGLEKNLVAARISSTTLASSETKSTATKKGRNVKAQARKTQSKQKADGTKQTNRKRKPVKKRSTKAQSKAEENPPLIDEIIRAGPRNDDILNNSIVAVDCNDMELDEPLPKTKAPEIITELDNDELLNKIEVLEDNNIKKIKNLNIKKNLNDRDIVNDLNKTTSPLPGLIIETEQHNVGVDESSMSNIFQMFEGFYNDKPHDNDNLIDDTIDHCERSVNNVSFSPKIYEFRKETEQRTITKNTVDLDDLQNHYIEVTRNDNETLDVEVSKLTKSIQNRETTSEKNTNEIINYDSDVSTQVIDNHANEKTDSSAKDSNEIEEYETDTSSQMFQPKNVTNRSLTANESKQKTITKPKVFIHRLQPREIQNWIPYSSQSDGPVERKRRLRLSDLYIDGNDFQQIINAQVHEEPNQKVLFNMKNLSSRISPVRVFGADEPVPNDTQNECVLHDKSITTDNESVESGSLCSVKVILPRRLSYGTESPCSVRPNRPKEGTPASVRKMDVLTNPTINNSTNSSPKNSEGSVATSINKGDDVKTFYEEFLEKALEKMDTTFAETHQANNNKFRNIIASLGKDMLALKHYRIQTYKETMKEIAEKFDAIEEKFQDKDNEIIEKLERQMCDVIRKNMAHTRASVLILKEDLEAVVNHLKRKRSRTDSYC